MLPGLALVHTGCTLICYIGPIWLTLNICKPLGQVFEAPYGITVDQVLEYGRKAQLTTYVERPRSILPLQCFAVKGEPLVSALPALVACKGSRALFICRRGGRQA
jgi:hypothetical protein